MAALALNTVANIGGQSPDRQAALFPWMESCSAGPEFADNLFTDISRMILAQSNAQRALKDSRKIQPKNKCAGMRLSPYIKRKACICLLRLYRKDMKLCKHLSESILGLVSGKRRLAAGGEG